MNLCGIRLIARYVFLVISLQPLAHGQQQPQQPLFSIASFDSDRNFALDTACDSIYRRSIPSCQPFDFSTFNPCSLSCTQSLQVIQKEAQAACASQGGIPNISLLGFFRNGTGVNHLCTTLKSGTATTLMSQVASSTSPTIPPGAGGVSTATEIPADASKATSMDLGKNGVVIVIVIVVVISVLLSLASLFYYQKHYRNGRKQ